MNDMSIFGLDIGTRSVVGTVGHKDENDNYIVDAMSIKEHETRAMLDGQIHDVGKVVDAIKIVKAELERKVDFELKEVCIAAAGRVLKTIDVSIEREIENDAVISEKDVEALELMAVEKAYAELAASLNDKQARFYCVGYSAVGYSLNGYSIKKLQGHKGENMGVQLLATFLPTEVVEDLYTAVEEADLRVANLTLEPIAAMNVAVPEKFRLLNIALVDVGAGTSDICITRDGSIIAYGMIPCAGDEISEYIAKENLVDFAEAERIKKELGKKMKITFEDIIGISHSITSSEMLKSVKECYSGITKQIADKIIELNGGKTTSAVFLVGGGGKVKGFSDCLAKDLGISKDRVAIRGEEVLRDVEFIEDIEKDSMLVTPIGICLDYYEHMSNFINIIVNDEQIKLFNSSKLKMSDLATYLSISMNKLFAKRGQSITYSVNGKKYVSKGEYGEAALLTVNGKRATLNTVLKNNDIIQIKESTVGRSGSKKIYELNEYKPIIEYTIDGKKLQFLRPIKVNGNVVDSDYDIQNGDRVEVQDYLLAEEIARYMEMDQKKALCINNMILSASTPVLENAQISTLQFTGDDSHNYVEIDNDTDIYMGMDVHEVIEDEEYKNIEYKDIEEIDELSEENIYEGFVDNSVKIELEETEDIGKKAIKPDKSKKKEMLNVSLSDTSIETDNMLGTNNAISVDVNGSIVELKPKSNHIFVDILDSYPFDTSTYRGNGLVMNVNSQKADFTTPIHNNDKIELYWAE